MAEQKEKQMSFIIPPMNVNMLTPNGSVRLDDGTKKIICSTIKDEYCRQMKDGHSICDEEAEICRLMRKHNGGHCWSKLYV